PAVPSTLATHSQSVQYGQQTATRLTAHADPLHPLQDLAPAPDARRRTRSLPTRSAGSVSLRLYECPVAQTTGLILHTAAPPDAQTHPGRSTGADAHRPATLPRLP